MHKIPKSPLHHIIAPMVYRIMGYSSLDLHQIVGSLEELDSGKF